MRWMPVQQRCQFSLQVASAVSAKHHSSQLCTGTRRGFAAQPSRDDDRKRLSNQDIPHDKFILIDSSGSNLGITLRKDALAMVDKTQVLALVQHTPPVCRILSREAWDALVASDTPKPVAKKVTTVKKEKEMEINSTISPHDLTIKMDRVKAFLAKGYDVKFALTWRKQGVNLQDLYHQIVQALAGLARLGGKPVLAGKKMNFVLKPERKRSDPAASKSKDTA
ncbi:hypothetical protein HDU91_002555 [Kappamyces sp. JEL0680]|nr:hypothetical protein HDU91_002555 [Kappamyces sp. JEL0680]